MMSYAAIVVFCLTALVIPVIAPAAGAADIQESVRNPSTAEFGGGTRAWLELQRSGQAAAAARSVSGVVGSRIYKRYLDSFEHPLPAFFERESTDTSTQ